MICKYELRGLGFPFRPHYQRTLSDKFNGYCLELHTEITKLGASEISTIVFSHVSVWGDSNLFQFWMAQN